MVLPLLLPLLSPRLLPRDSLQSSIRGSAVAVVVGTCEAPAAPQQLR